MTEKLSSHMVLRLYGQMSADVSVNLRQRGKSVRQKGMKGT
jgi:hypothetical protein